MEEVYKRGEKVRVFFNGDWRDGTYVARNADPNLPHAVSVTHEGMTQVTDREEGEVAKMESKAAYQFGDPVEVLLPEGWREGFYVGFRSHSTDDLPHLAVIRDAGSSVGAITHSTMGDRIRPRAVAPRSGWRLPEPGDVVRVLIPGVNFEEGVVKAWEDGRLNPVVVAFPNHGQARYSPTNLEPVRLHDAPADAPAKEAEPASQEGFAPGRPVCKRDNPNRKGWIAERMDVPNDAWTINWHDGTQTWCYEGSLRLLADSEVVAQVETPTREPKASPLIRAAFKMLDALDECAKARADEATDGAGTLDAMAEQSMLEIVRNAMERATLAERRK